MAERGNSIEDEAAIDFLIELTKRANSDALDAQWWLALGSMVIDDWHVVPPLAIRRIADLLRAHLVTGEPIPANRPTEDEVQSLARLVLNAAKAVTHG